MKEGLQLNILLHVFPPQTSFHINKYACITSFFSGRLVFHYISMLFVFKKPLLVWNKM